MDITNKTKVSVILPSYNVVNYIEQCVDSVLNQTLKEIEIICIDAGSSDGTWDLLQSASLRDNRLRLIRSEIKSYGYQMNLGIREARGDYVGIVETDDYIDSDMFEVLYNNAVLYGVDMAKGVLYEVYSSSDGREKEILWDYISDRYTEDVVFSPSDDLSVHEWDGNIWNGIYKRDFLLNNEIWFQESPGASYQDIAFQQMVLNEAERVLYIHSHFYHYRRVRPEASTWNPNCVSFINYAYKGLLSDTRIKSDHKGHIYTRLAPAFLVELRKTLCMNGYDLSAEECSGAVAWYEDEIKTAIREKMFKIDDLSGCNREDVKAFIGERDMYVSRLSNQMESAYAWMEKVRKVTQGKRLFIFGTGQFGQLLMMFLIKNGIWIDGLVDNQKRFNNVSYYGLRVQSASDALRCGEDTVFLVASKKYGKQIYGQLHNLGVTDNRIIIFDGSDTFLLEAMQRYPILPRRDVKQQVGHK